MGMTKEEENEIVNTSVNDMTKRLVAGGKKVDAVVLVVFFEGGGDFHVGATINAMPENATDVEQDRVEGTVLMEAADLLDDYVHQRGLCGECNEKKGPLQ